MGLFYCGAYVLLLIRYFLHAKGILIAMKKPGLSARTRKLTRKQELCIACQKCCKELGVYTFNGFYEDEEAAVVHFYETRGCTLTRGESGLMYLSMKIPCPHLTPAGCDIYDTRPEICRKYSGLEELGEECLWSGLEDGEE